MVPQRINIAGCEIVPICANRDNRGCLYEVYRRSWPNAFPTVQWNVCASKAGVVRGVHVHVDYHEFYTLPQGRVLIGLSDIRRDSPTFGTSTQFEWVDHDGVAIVVPIGVAHVILFEADSVLVFGLSDYWKPGYDIVGCQWDDPALKFNWPTRLVDRSQRDINAPNYGDMLRSYEERSLAWSHARGDVHQSLTQ